MSQVERSPQEAATTEGDNLRATPDPFTNRTSDEVNPSLPGRTSTQDEYGFEDVDGPGEETARLARGGLPILPDQFWQARSHLALIRAIAHSRMTSADAVFYTLLARLAAMVPATARVETGQKTPASLNLMVALVGPSGFGKSSAADVARTRLAPNRCVELADNLPLGSGEGLAEAYMGEIDLNEGDDDGSKRGPAKRGRSRTIRVQDKHNAFFYLDEGEALFKVMHERQGSTLGPTLRTAWSGGTIGSQNATKERTRKAEDYCLGLVIGFQKKTALPLLQDHVAGTPQRFLWCSVIDTTIPAEKPDDIPDTIEWNWASLSGLQPAEGPDPTDDLSRRVRDRGIAPKLSCHPEIREHLWRLQHGKVTGQIEVDEQDSHKPLMLIKVAGLLAILDGRTEINPDDWQLAEQVWDHSSAVRDSLLRYSQQLAQDENERRLELTRRKAAAEEEGRDEHAQKQVSQATIRVARAVGRSTGGLVRKDLKDTLGSRARKYLDEAIEAAKDAGWLVEQDGRYLPGPTPPPGTTTG
ncbi:hypothetical protein [Micromonospora chalcea]|uniref:hypothetical protein n=1 Tax=Micromonospora chalcea TaxID=1874 RepID=UPI0033D2B14C